MLDERSCRIARVPFERACDEVSYMYVLPQDQVDLRRRHTSLGPLLRGPPASPGREMEVRAQSYVLLVNVCTCCELSHTYC